MGMYSSRPRHATITMLRSLVALLATTCVRAVQLDAANAILGAAPMLAPQRPATQYGLNNMHQAPAAVQASMRAALMSPFPVLAQMMYQSLQQSAAATASAASSLLDLSVSEDLTEDEELTGATAMVGAAAAAVALYRMTGRPA